MNSFHIHVTVTDATVDEWTVPFAENSIDVIVLIFVLSSVHPDKCVIQSNEGNQDYCLTIIVF